MPRRVTYYVLGLVSPGIRAALCPVIAIRTSFTLQRRMQEVRDLPPPQGVWKTRTMTIIIGGGGGVCKNQSTSEDDGTTI